MSPPLKTPSTRALSLFASLDPPTTPLVLLEAPHYLWTRGLRVWKERSRPPRSRRDEPCHGGEIGKEEEGKGWREQREGPSTMGRLGDSETSAPGILNGRRMRSLPRLDRRTMHSGKRMLTWTITCLASRDRSFLEFPRGGRSCRDLSAINFIGNDDKRVIKWMVTARMKRDLSIRTSTRGVQR